MATSTNYKILLVEDAEIASKAASTLLEKMGYEVCVAQTGKQAIEWVERTHFDIIFMDLGLPDMDGFSTTEGIRRIELQLKQFHTPIIALTKHEGEHIKDTCEDASMDDFLVKPLTEESVQRILTQHLQAPH